MTPKAERRALQIVVALAGCVPVSAGLLGALTGTFMLDMPLAGLTGERLVEAVSADSHVRYLSGLLLGIGLAFWLTIPRIEAHRGRFRLLTAIVFIGGLARLLGLVLHGAPDGPMLFGLVMELLVTPAICLWQGRVAARFGEMA